MTRLTITLLAALVLATVTGTSAKAQVNAQDSLALVALYNWTNGSGWTNNSNWRTGPVDTWYGVTVSGGRVTRLELASNGLSSPSVSAGIPPEIGDLSQLQVLDLRSNRLRGPFPAEIANLLQLQVLNLQSNGLRRAVPAEMANLTNLEQLHLNDNDLEDLPDLSAIGALTTLSVENNRLTFEDIEPNVGLAPTFTYAPQDQVGGVQLQKVSEGDSLDLHIPVGGMHNQYQWYKDGVALAGATSDRYTVASMTLFDVGTYVLEITNTLATDLTLTSRPMRYSFAISQWLDIGAYHHAYAESGARHEGGTGLPEGMEYPAILRHSGHIRAKAFWIGVKDWTDPQGQHYPFYVARWGPRGPGLDASFPIQNKLIGRYEDTVVEVNGMASFDNEAILDEIDPSLAADRMIHNIHNMAVGITTERKIYAYTNEYHDNYHLIEYTYCNTGNTDGNAEIELPNQTLHEVYFFRIHRWRGNEQAARVSGPRAGTAQVWGRYTMNDVVGDGHAEYPVDFTAQYAWYGYNSGSFDIGYNNLGSSLFTDDNERVAEGDSVGRLAGPTMVGRSTIHADNAPTDKTYDPAVQPHTIGWINNDEELTADGSSHQDYYELGILTRENPERNPGCTSCSSRMYPHYADRIEPSGEFWDPRADASLGRAGGWSPTIAYGPYEMAPGECVNVVVSEGIAGLSFDAATKIGRAYKRGGGGREAKIIEYDANGDGVIDTTPFDYDNVFVGTEAQTKNQWVMTARDSLFQMFYRARDLYAASNNMTTYPILEPPRAPVRFSLWGRPAAIDLEWTPASAGPAVDHWELYRTDRWEDNLYVNGCLDDLSIACGYEMVASLSVETTSYTDTDVLPDSAYFYYIEGVGQPQPVDPRAITGTPYGLPLRSSRYLTQTYTPVVLQTNTAVDDEAVPERFALEGNYPNPFNPATRIRYALPHRAPVRLVVYDVRGRLVAVLLEADQAAGWHEVTFEAGALSSGVYFYRLEAGAFRQVRSMLLVK